ncbi:MAG: hypothetical protein K0A90_07835, partial [Methanosarcinaceae archaeon]|nr:hypothetical protein [Methanosarcinaceae archaeon]
MVLGFVFRHSLKINHAALNTVLLVMNLITARRRETILKRILVRKWRSKTSSWNCGYMEKSKMLHLLENKPFKAYKKPD